MALNSSNVYLPPKVAAQTPKKLIKGAPAVTPQAPTGKSFTDLMKIGGGSLNSESAKSNLAGNISLGSGGTVFGGVSNYRTPASSNTPVGVKAASPTASVKKPATTLPATQKAPVQPASSGGAYKGVPIDIKGDVAAQMAKIDAGQAEPPVLTKTTKPVSSGNPSPTPTYPGLMGAQIQARDQAASAPTYSGLVGSLASASQPSAQQRSLTSSLANAANPTHTQTGLVRDLRNAGNANTAIGQQGKAIADLYAPEIGRIGGLGAAAQAGYNSTGTNVVGAGNAAIASQSASQRMAALAQAEQAQLYGVDKQLTAQNQLQSAYGASLTGANTQQAQQLSGLGAAGNQANTQQAQQLSGLGAAAGYAQPQLGSIGQVPFNPIDQGQGAVLGSTQPGGVAAAGQLLGQFQGAQTLGAAPYGAEASNINTRGTTATNIAATGAGQAVQAYNQMNAANTQFEGQASQLLSTLTQYQNNGTIPALNQPINRFSGALGSTAVSALNAAFAETQAAYTNLLSSSGGTPTSQDQQAIASLNINSTPQQIATSIQQLQAAARIKLGAAQNLAQGYGSSLYNSGGQGAQGGVVQTKAGPVNTGW